MLRSNQRTVDLSYRGRITLLPRMLPLLVLIAVGCNKADVDKMVEQVQQQTQVVQQEVAKVVPVGSVQLSLQGDVKAQSCTASLIVIGDGRPNVIQIRSYPSMQFEAFPSIFFQGTTNAGSYQELVGKTLSGEMFVAIDNAANVWQSDASTGASVTFSAVDGSELVGSFGTVSMVNPEGKTTSTSGGFRALMDAL